MSFTERLFEERLSRALEGAGLPPAWRELRVPAGRERQAAAVLLELAETGGEAPVAAMAEKARAMSAAVAAHRARRGDGEEGDRGAEELWRRLAELLAALEAPAGVALHDLALWRQWRGGGEARSAVTRELRDLEPPAPERLMPAIARMLLRARAVEWKKEAS